MNPGGEFNATTGLRLGVSCSLIVMDGLSSFMSNFSSGPTGRMPLSTLEKNIEGFLPEIFQKSNEEKDLQQSRPADEETHLADA